jgi:5-methylcytosine-specific restriction endonuclease McrA
VPSPLCRNCGRVKDLRNGSSPSPRCRFCKRVSLRKTDRAHSDDRVPGYQYLCSDCDTPYINGCKQRLPLCQFCKQSRRIKQKIAATKRWTRRNPDLANELQKCAQHLRRARERGAIGSFTPSEWAEIVDRQNGKCLHCCELKPLTRDHIVPLSKGGSNLASNIQGLCKSCNSRKRDKVPEQLAR